MLSIRKSSLFMCLVLVIIAFVYSACGNPAGGGGTGSWTVVENSTFGTSTIMGVAWGKDKFVAVASNGKMAYSLEGKNWTAVGNPPPGISTYYDVVWGKDKFVATGANGKMAYSTDGIGWTEVTNTTFGTGDCIEGIAYGSNKFIAVSRPLKSPTTGKLAYSDNGINWEQATIPEPFKTTGLSSVCWGKNKFIAAIHGSHNPSNLVSSTDGGNTWQEVTGYHTSCTITGLAYGEGIGTFIVGTATATEIYHSLDGQNWNIETSALNTKSIQAIAWGNGRFVVAHGGTMIRSSDGNNWTEETNQISFTGTRDIAFGNGVFVAVGGGGTIAYSK